MCRDLSTAIQVVGRLAFYFTDDFKGRLNPAIAFMEQLVGLLRYSDRYKLYLVDALLAEVHAEALAAVKEMAPWMAEFGRTAAAEGNGGAAAAAAPATPPPAGGGGVAVGGGAAAAAAAAPSAAQQRFRAVVTAVIELSLLPFHLPAGLVVKPVVSQGAAQLLDAVTRHIKPPFLLEIPCIGDSIKRGGVICAGLEPTTRLAVATSLSNALLLPPTGVQQRALNWEPRAAKHRELVGGLLQTYIQLQSQPDFAAGRISAAGEVCIKDACAVLSALAKSVREQPMVTKDVLVKTLTPLLPSALLMLRALAGKPAVLSLVLQMFYDFFDGLGNRLDAGFIQQTVDTFLAVFTPDQLAVLVTPDGMGNPGVVKFLEILGFFVQDRGKAFKRYLPEIVSLCVDRIYPIVADLPTISIRLALFDVLRNVLLENWRYFYPSKVVRAAVASAAETLENQAHFGAILKALCVSLRQPDLNQFKTNLATLQELNQHNKLYHKEFFRGQVLAVLLEILFSALINKSHDLLSEEIVSAVHDLAAVDFAAFFSGFLSQLLVKTPNVNDAQRRELASHFTGETDIPTFTRNVRVFVNDLILFQQSNTAA